MNRPDEETRYARAMLSAGRLWRQVADRALAGLPVSSSSGWALLQLGRLGEDARQIDLARQLDITGPSLVRLIDQLERDDLAERHTHPTDRRAIRLRLTPRGEALVGEIETLLVSLRAEMLAGISDEALETALEVARIVESRSDLSRPGQ